MLGQATQYHKQTTRLQILAERASASGLVGFRLAVEVRQKYNGDPSGWTPSDLQGAFCASWRGVANSKAQYIPIGYTIFLRRAYSPDPSMLDMPRLDIVAWATPVKTEQWVALFTKRLHHALPAELGADPFCLLLRDPLGEATHYLGITYDREGLDREWAARWGITRVKIIRKGASAKHGG